MRLLILPIGVALSILVSACGGGGAASEAETIAAFKRQGIALEADPLDDASGDCKKKSRASSGEIVSHRSCFSFTVYLGKGKPLPLPTHSLTPALRAAGSFAVYVYQSAANAKLVLDGEDEVTELEPLFGKRVSYYRGRNVVVMCLDCSKNLLRIKSALNDL